MYYAWFIPKPLLASIRGKIVHETGPWYQQCWGLLFQSIEQPSFNLSPSTHVPHVLSQQPIVSTVFLKLFHNSPMVLMEPSPSQLHGWNIWLSLRSSGYSIAQTSIIILMIRADPGSSHQVMLDAHCPGNSWQSSHLVITRWSHTHRRQGLELGDVVESPDQSSLCWVCWISEHLLTNQLVNQQIPFLYKAGGVGYVSLATAHTLSDEHFSGPRLPDCQ